MQEFYTIAMILSIATFTLSTSISPGPNNIMLLSSGLTFGYKKTIPHMTGVFFGFPLMVLIVGLGMGALFEKFPLVLSVLKFVGILYLFWMAYKIANNTSSYDVEENSESKPFSFMQAAMFQWVNPKAWIMAITSISVFVTSNEHGLSQIIIISIIYFLSGCVSCNTWAFGGTILKKFIKSEKSVQRLNILMAILLVASVLPIIFE